MSKRNWLRLLLVLDLVTLYWLCLTPRSITICEQGLWWQVWTWCLPELPTWFGNLVLLVPTALFISWLRRDWRWWYAAGIAAGISGVIEIVRMYLHWHRGSGGQRGAPRPPVLHA